MKKKFILAAVVAFALIQLPFLAPAKTNPPIEVARTFRQVMNPPRDVETILERACYDCHSYATHWPLYSYVAPVSWFIGWHVQDGRKHLNFHSWIDTAGARFTDWNQLENVCTELKEKKMPLPGYDWLHPGARLTDADRQTVCQWVDSALANAR